MNPVAYISQMVQGHVLRDHTKVDPMAFCNGQTLVRFHSHKFDDGDMSFAINSKIWQKYYGEECSRIFPKNEKELHLFSEELLLSAKDWRFPLERIELLGERVSLYFQRTALITELVQMVLNGKTKSLLENYGHLPKNPLRRIHCFATAYDESNLSYYRASLIYRTLKSVLAYSEWIEVEKSQKDEDDVLQIEVVSVADANRDNEELLSSETKVVKVYCGILVDPRTGKGVTIDTAEYINLRRNDLNLMALHKYGIRSKDDKRYCDLMDSLGVSAVTVDLLEKKCSSPSSIIRNGQGSNTKGACFILYNSARLETLLKTFEVRVSEGRYEPLPPIEKVDLALLSNEEEWQLVYVYIFTFPDLIERCFRQLESGQFASHLIIQYLSGLASTFSVYYRRIRILTEYRPQLMAQLYARIYLLKALQNVLNKALGLLNITPVSHM